MSDLKKGMTVICKALLHYPAGKVLRVAKDGSWCDVAWSGRIVRHGPIEYWTKRMRQQAVLAEPQ